MDNTQDFSFVVDRQIRSDLLIVNPKIKYTENVKIIADNLSTNVFSILFDRIINDYRIDPSKFFLNYNGVNWARSKSFHVKAHISPDEFVNKKLYPRWTRKSAKTLYKEYERRWKGNPLDSLNILAKNLICSEKYSPDSSLHGYYKNELVNEDELLTELQNLEKYLYSRGIEGCYSINITKVGKQYFIASILDEDTFIELNPQMEISKTYIKSKRNYYIKKRIPSVNYIIPTPKKIIFK